MKKRKLTIDTESTDSLSEKVDAFIRGQRSREADEEVSAVEDLRTAVEEALEHVDNEEARSALKAYLDSLPAENHGSGDGGPQGVSVKTAASMNELIREFAGRGYLNDRRLNPDGSIPSASQEDPL